MKTKRGQKLCSNCKTINGVRSYECKECGNKFKKKILRDLSLSGKIKFEGDTVSFTSNISGNIDG